MASIKKRVNKKGISFLITVSNGYKPDGTKVFETTTFKPESDMTPRQAEKAAQQYALRFEELVKNGKLFEGDKMTFSAFIVKWRENHAVNVLEETTLLDYERQLNNWLLPHLGGYKMSKITLPVIEDTYQKILTKIQADSETKTEGYATIEKCHNILSGIFRTAVRWSIIEVNPCKEACLPKKKEKTHKKLKYFTPQQALLFLKSLDETYYTTYKAHKRTNNAGNTYCIETYTEPHKISTMFKVLFYIALLCGMRKGELLALTWDDIDMENLTIKVSKSAAVIENRMVIKTTKNISSNREITFPEKLLPLLQYYKKEQEQLQQTYGTYYSNPEGYLFTQDNGNIMHYSTPYHKMQKIIQYYNFSVNADEKLSAKEKEELLLPKIPFHGLRHSCATLLKFLNVDYVDIAEKLGHAQVSTTMNIYLHTFKEQERITSEKLDSFLDNQAVEKSTICLLTEQNETTNSDMV